MSVEKELFARSGNQCEMCTSTEGITAYLVEPQQNAGRVDDYVCVCSTCKEQIEDTSKMEANHWRCLNDSMWSEIESVKVMAWRMLQRLKAEGWPQDFLDMLYMEDEILEWA